ncbi:MAG: hypothetical protein FWH03_04305 [Firmicutes bacterium]|nr:hypothetical protein [Bacillota bacterium]
MKDSLHAVILKVSYEKTGDTSAIEILGKSMLDWLALSLGDTPYQTTAFSADVELPLLVRPFINPDSEYTAVLYSDTPLMTKKTILDAVCALRDSGRNLLKMTRGFLFKTEYLARAEKLYATEVFYFDEEDFITAFNFKQISMISDILRGRILNYHMERGVQIEDTASAFIGPDVRIGTGTVIGPNTIIKGTSVIKNNVKLLAGSTIENSIIEEGAHINASQIYKSYIGENTRVGPWAYIRPETVVGPNCRIGDFVELKASIIGKGCKISHLAYVGDAELGENCNVGCGAVFVNYDGKNKFKTKAGDNVFIGSNANLIAPLLIENNAFIAAGSTINKNIPANNLAIARERQTNKPDWKKPN